MPSAATILPPYQPLAGDTTQRLNWPSATAALVVQVTGRALPWAWLLVPVGAVTAMALKTARHVDRARREAVDAPGVAAAGAVVDEDAVAGLDGHVQVDAVGVAGGAVGGDDLAPVPAVGGGHHPEAELAVGDGGVGGPGDRQGAALGLAAGACRGGDGDAGDDGAEGAVTLPHHVPHRPPESSEPVIVSAYSFSTQRSASLEGSTWALL